MDKIQEERIILPSIFQDHMMLQRGKRIRIQGCAASDVQGILAEYQSPDICVKVEIVPEGNRFTCEFPSLEAGTGGELRFYINGEDEAALTIRDILVGDIFLAGGQSNMEYFLRYDAHWNDIRRMPVNHNIRMYNVPRIAFEGQRRELPGDGHWFEQGDPAWPLFSAPGFCFARVIQEKIGIPVGVVGCNWGGTPACAWMDRACLEKEPVNVWLSDYEEAVKGRDPRDIEAESLKGWEFEDSWRHEQEWRPMMYGETWEEQERWMLEHADDPVIPQGPFHHYRPSGLYHTMIKKIAPFPLKGILWYQGESDEAHAEIYDQTMERLVSCFRDTWEDQELPFLYVQIAPFERWLDCRGDHYPAIRQSQERALQKISNAWMTCVSDLGDRDDIHPKFKREVGERLALLAMGKIYGREILCEPPECISAEMTGEVIRLSFAHSEGGLTVEPGKDEPFMITENGRELRVVEMQPDGDGLLLKISRGHADGKSPDGIVHIAYAMTPYFEVHIKNRAGLPLKPFETSAVIREE